MSKVHFLIILRHAVAASAFGLLGAPAFVAGAQAPQRAEPASPEPLIAASAANDSEIEQRIAAIFAQIDSLKAVTVNVQDGVVTLGGTAANGATSDRAEQIALRLQGVVTVENQIDRTLTVEEGVSPLIGSFQSRMHSFYRSLPLYGVALGVFLIIAFLANMLAGWKSLWRRLMPNPFLAELISGAVRLIGILIGLVIAMNILSATAMMGTILGGAGVIGLALGFAVRDTLENYISSIMLSVRQPFRANDHVVIDAHEGKVVRLTSRSTVLMTLDGNHLRIPNTLVFKSVILNYTRNPERRFNFDLGVDAADDPVAAMQKGLSALKKLPFILTTPGPEAYIETVGDSNIMLSFHGWLDQEDTNYRKARGLAISATKDALETGGFTLPEPIYRLRVEGGGAPTPALSGTRPGPKSRKPAEDQDAETAGDVAPDHYIDRKVNEERAVSVEDDLLDSGRPVE
jgi:small-conductance mechanosensitive channel